MRNLIHASLLTAIVSLLAVAPSGAQQAKPSATTKAFATDVAITYAAERGQPVPGATAFWFQGGTADVNVGHWKGFGAAASFSTGTASNIADGANIKKIVFVAGPRYTRSLISKKDSPEALQVFAQTMFGVARGFHGIFPANGGAVSHANSPAIELGGGLNYIFKNGSGLRLIDAEYMRSTFPNAADNVQNDFRLGAGFIVRFGK
jgi:hypothetical protein